MEPSQIYTQNQVMRMSKNDTLGLYMGTRQPLLSVVSEFKELGNPYDEQGDEPIAVHTRDVMESAVVDTVQTFCKLRSRSMIVMFKKA